MYYARNNDLSPYLKEGSKSEIYKITNKNKFNITTSSFVNGEEGINEKVLDVAMTFVGTILQDIKPGFNSVFIVRYLLEKANNVNEAKDLLLDLPNDADRDTLVKYWYDDSQEMNGVDSISIEQAKKDVLEFLNSGRFYVLRNGSGKKKRYATNLIYLMTNDILSKGYVPLLYTDYDYIPSNKAYINAGYEDTWILINFSCSKQIIKNKTK